MIEIVVKKVVNIFQLVFEKICMSLPKLTINRALFTFISV